MDKDKGFLMIYNSFFESNAWREVTKRKFTRAEAVIDLLRMVRYGDGAYTTSVDGVDVLIHKGEVVVSLRYLSKRWRRSRTFVSSLIEELIDMKTFVTRSVRWLTVLGYTASLDDNIYREYYGVKKEPSKRPAKEPSKRPAKEPSKKHANNDEYQSLTDSEKPPKRPAKEPVKEPTKRPAKVTNKNIVYKEDRYKEDITPISPYPNLDNYDHGITDHRWMEIIELWLQHKKEIKFKYQPTGFKTMVNQLYKYSEGDIDIARQIVERSIANGWKGLFKLKKNETNRTANQQGYNSGSEERKRAIMQQIASSLEKGSQPDPEPLW